MKRILFYIIPVVICIMVGFIASQLQGDSIETWYPFINKSSLNPPDIVFPVAWTLLYICMGISIGYIMDRGGPEKKLLVNVFIIQLVLNFLWTFCFFYLKNPLLGLVDIILLEIILIYYVIKALPRYKLSAYLFIPYVVWVVFATYLNLFIYINN